MERERLELTRAVLDAAFSVAWQLGSSHRASPVGGPGHARHWFHGSVAWHQRSHHRSGAVGGPYRARHRRSGTVVNKPEDGTSEALRRTRDGSSGCRRASRSGL